MATHHYQDLIVWQKSMDLVEDVYRLCEKLPKTEIYALCDQMKRSAVSVPSNIAEGQKRLGTQETIHFTGIALGSLAELETQILLCNRLFKINTDKEAEQCVIIGKMLTALVRSLRSKL